MRLFLVIDETHFYHPNFVDDLLKLTEHKIVGAALVTKVLPKSDIELYMIRKFYYLTISELLKLGFKKLNLFYKDQLYKPGNSNQFYSVKKVFEYYSIDYFTVEYDINKRKYIDKIKKKSPDIIISSNSLIFGKELLGIPKYCINRHSSLLPSYGGLWPVFQAVRNNEIKVGVSVHTMETAIDKGILLAQTEIPIQENDTLDILYKKCFAKSAETVVSAIKKIEKNNLESFCNNYKESYFSFPHKAHWRQLRERKIKFI